MEIRKMLTGAFHVQRLKPGVVCYGSAVGYPEYGRPTKPGAYSDLRYDVHGTPYVRGHKSHGEKLCSGKSCLCMAGKGGKCVLCDNHD
jgi:hypothetical protein